MRSLLIASWCAGCSFQGPALTGDGGSTVDARDGNLTSDSGTDSGGNGNDGRCSFSSLIDTCTQSFGGIVTVDGGPASCWEYDSDTNTLAKNACSGNSGPTSNPPSVVADGVVFWLVSGFTMTSGTKLTLLGTKPVAIISTGAVSIAGAITVFAGQRVAAQCGGMDGASNATGGGGGGGGGYRQAGGRGGNGTSTNGGNGGGLTSLPATLIGGCPGGTGGAGVDAAAPGGDGGGALHIAAGSTISITSTGAITAPGAGGQGGVGGGSNGGPGYLGGGGGGGSGGLVWLESSTILIRGAVAANGGGGGEGSGVTKSGNNGAAGQASAARASGGSGNDSAGGDGGAGGASAMTPAPGAAQSSGGGGGGGTGFIRLLGGVDATGATISPPPS